MKLRPTLFTLLAAVLCAGSSLAAEATPADHVLVASKQSPNDRNWRDRPTRIIEKLPGFTPADSVPTSRWGGLLSQRVDQGTGFFRVARADNGRWWFIDPEGYRFLHVGVAGVYEGRNEVAMATTRQKFADSRAFADFTLRTLADAGFNGMGGWTERDVLTGHPELLPYTVSFDVTAALGRHLDIAHLNPGQTGYVNEVPPIFHPKFPDWVDAYFARRLPALKDDPWIVGYFSDNELPLRRDLLDRSLTLDPAREDVAPMRSAAESWLRARRGADATIDVATLSDDDRVAFLTEACEKYFSTVAAAIRRHAPNHLYLGSRFHGRVTQQPEVFRVAGRHVDVVSINLYHAWEVRKDRLAMWTAESGRPIIITEFYAKGMDTGMKNENGAGWVVKTQRDRGDFYQNFTLSLLQTGQIVGWHWFKYRDNEPFDTTAMEGNQDSNKGIIAWDYSPFTDLIDRMRALNRQVYPLTEYFDRNRQP